MIVKALTKSGRATNGSTPIERIYKPNSTKKDKRFLVCVESIDNKVHSYVYDLVDQKILFKSISNKNIEQIFEEIYSMYNRHDSKVVESTSLKEILSESDLLPLTQRIVEIKKVKEELSKPRVLQESIHVRKVRETYKYLDKYKVKLKVKVIKSSDNCATIYLHDEENGIDIGTHVLDYDYSKGLYKYTYMGTIVTVTKDLEVIFK